MLSDEILAQGDYATRGKRDTTNASDFLFLSGKRQGRSGPPFHGEAS
jgi:hypothetical protein